MSCDEVTSRYHFIEEAFPRNTITAIIPSRTKHPVSFIVKHYLRKQCYPCAAITLLTQDKVPIAPDTPWNEIQWGSGGVAYFRVEDREPVIALRVASSASSNPK